MRIITLRAENVKLCPVCVIEKPHGEFYFDRTKRLRIGTYCKSCSITIAAATYERRKAMPKVTPEFKLCGTCTEELPASAFWGSAAALDGLMPECKDCRRERVRGYRYGLPPGEYDRMLEEQARCCASCGSDNQLLVVDHRHSDGIVRGLVCGNCNTAIGLMGDDPDRLIAAALYLIKTAEVPS